MLKEKQDYERMQIEQKKLEQEMADTLKQRSRHISVESGGWMESGVKPKPFKGPKMPCFEESKDNIDAFFAQIRDLGRNSMLEKRSVGSVSISFVEG